MKASGAAQRQGARRAVSGRLESPTPQAMSMRQRNETIDIPFPEGPLSNPGPELPRHDASQRRVPEVAPKACTADVRS